MVDYYFTVGWDVCLSYFVCVHFAVVVILICVCLLCLRDFLVCCALFGLV